MKWNLRCPFYYICILLFCFVFGVLGELGNPYTILGIHSKASQHEIRQAYIQLAKEWHPDKSSSPKAAEKFVEIKQAYELLSDPERKLLYDHKGITEEDLYKGRKGRKYDTQNPFERVFNSEQDYFNFQQNDITFFHQLAISERHFNYVIKPKTDRIPYLLFFYSDWCFACLEAASYCRKLNDNLKQLGINFATVHHARDPNLSRKLNVHTLPSLVLVIDGNGYVFKEKINSFPKIIEFIKSKFPYKLLTTLTETNLEEFLDGWTDNRVRALILPQKNHVKLRYLVTAFHFRHRVAFGIADTKDVHQKYESPSDIDSILIFNENVSHPKARVFMKDIPVSGLYNFISSNQYLALPRLSSQKILDELCPCEWNMPKKKICVALVTEESVTHDPHRQTFRQYAEKFPYKTQKIRFAYIYHKRQSHFINALRPDGEYMEPLLRIVLFWRRDSSIIRYEWAPIKWELENKHNNTHEKLAETILRLVKTTENFPYETYVTDLFDEHANGLLKRMFNRVCLFLENVYNKLDKEQILWPLLSVFGTTLFIIGVGYLISYLVKKEEENMQKRANAGNNNNNSKSNYQPELKLHELRSEKYNGLVRLLKPGCRTVLLILDMQSRQQLIPQFHRAVWPYRKNKTLSFAYMYIERGLTWYKELLQLSLYAERELNINPRNCVGTVLALNGHRKYFCVFHAKHTESNKKLSNNKNVPSPPLPLNEKDCESGAFIGFNSDDSDSGSEEVLLEGNLLDGLPNWLDRLFEGSTQRYHINYWPEFPIK